MVREECKKNMIYHVFHAFKAMKFWRERKKSELRRKEESRCLLRQRFCKEQQNQFLYKHLLFFQLLDRNSFLFCNEKGIMK